MKHAHARGKTAGVACALVLLPTVMQAQDWGRDGKVVWAETSVLPAGTIGGTVSRAEDGQPIAGAQVLLEGTTSGALSDSLGRFELVAPGVGQFTLASRLIGYGEARSTVYVPSDRGMVVHVELVRRRLSLCGLVVCLGGCGNLVVIARDALTGRAPRGPVVLRARRDTTVLWAFSTPEEEGEHALLSIEARRGAHDLEATAPGYRPWRTEVRVDFDECGLVVGGPRYAWLLPLRDPGRPD